MVAGRPKEHDRIQVGLDMVKWATNNPTALTVPMYAVSIGLHSGILRNWCTEDEQFHALYMQAKEQIGINRLKSTLSDAEKKLDSSIYRAHVGNYDIDINQYAREEKAYESNLRKQEENVKKTNYHVSVSHGLAIGADISTSPISTELPKGTK